MYVIAGLGNPGSKYEKQDTMWDFRLLTVWLPNII